MKTNHPLIRQLLEDMTQKERDSFYTLLMMDMSNALYIKSERIKNNGLFKYTDYTRFSLTKTLRELFPNRKKPSGAYRRVVLFDRVVLKFELEYYTGKTAVETEAKLYKKYAKKHGKIAKDVYLAPTVAISKHISVQKLIPGKSNHRESYEDSEYLDNTVGYGHKGSRLIDDIHSGNFRRVGKKIFIIDFAENY